MRRYGDARWAATACTHAGCEVRTAGCTKAPVKHAQAHAHAMLVMPMHALVWARAVPVRGVTRPMALWWLPSLRLSDLLQYPQRASGVYHEGDDSAPDVLALLVGELVHVLD